MVVLIETLWNVKSLQIKNRIIGKDSINRNIVECKENKRNGSVLRGIGINRNIVECKDSSFSTRKRSVCSINRNIVECKACCRKNHRK